MPQAYLSPIVDLHRKDQLFGLAERVVAVESLWELDLYLPQSNRHSYLTLLTSEQQTFLFNFTHLRATDIQI
jgi:hypothetical protein